ncbi:MAG: DNA cytosine methyltransferase, partial [Chloroflexota bacterium]|nr:DNA cytosine methyltransferase [Chloroflexota bacterium]
MSLGQPTAIDLFAGAGGFGLGFERSGFAVPLSLEVDTWASDTLRFNRPQMHVRELGKIKHPFSPVRVPRSQHSTSSILPCASDSVPRLASPPSS